MQIPDEIRKCVAFLACRRSSGYVTGGTVFFVGYPNMVKHDVFFVYAVTARHVVEEINRRSDGNVYFRMSTVQGGVAFEPIPASQWVFNQDSRVDVAVAQVFFDFSVFDHRFLSLNSFVTPELITQEELGIGDDLFFPGLFTQCPGTERNMPIVRIGNIAAMPEEPVTTAWGVLPPSYLVEARSIGGLSGSPVFWHRGMTRVRAGTWTVAHGSPLCLLGLVHGHYDEGSGTWDAGEATVTDGVSRRSANMGIAIVVPGDHILATLNHPDLERQRVALEMVGQTLTEEVAAPEAETADPSLRSHVSDTISGVDSAPDTPADP